MLRAHRRLRISASPSLEVWQPVWTEGSWCKNQRSQIPPREYMWSSLWRSALHFPCSQTFFFFGSFPWPAEPSSSAQGIMGKVCQLSRIWHLWAILSQGLFFKAPPERLAAGADVDIDHVTHFCMRLQARMKKKGPFLGILSYWLTFLRRWPGRCLELDGNFKN